MASDEVVLRAAQYGKAEVRLLHVDRRQPDHRITDLNVTVTLAGDQSDSYLTGDNAKVLTTDAQKNTVYAFARQHGVGRPEEFGLRLARHFATVPSVDRARVLVQQYGWQPVVTGGEPHPHAFERQAGTRVASVCAHADGRAEVVAGVTDLILLKSSGSEFEGFLEDPYTTLEPTRDRILATAVDARWRLAAAPTLTGTRPSPGPAPRWPGRSPTLTAVRCSRRCTRWARPCWPPARRCRRRGCRCPTSTISWSISARSGWTTRARSFTPRTGRTG